CRSETIEALRIIDQKRLPHGFAWRDLTDDIDQGPVVGDWPLMVGVRPVGTPDAAVAEFRHQPAREWHGVGVGRSLSCHAIGAADFYPDIPVVEEDEQRL